MAKAKESTQKQKAGNMHFDINTMADIIIILVQKFGAKQLIKDMINHLIRDESDYLVPALKSANAAALERDYAVSLKGLRRTDIWPLNNELSSKIIIEHGLLINVAIEECTKAKDSKEVAAILEEIKNSLIYITKDDNANLAEKGFSKNRKEGYKIAYKRCGIDLVDNK
jgi:hypothetical protein